MEEIDSESKDIINRENITQACDELIHAIYSVQDWNGTYVGECIDRLEAILYQR
jgi:hypothetical protein